MERVEDSRQRFAVRAYRHTGSTDKKSLLHKQVDFDTYKRAEHAVTCWCMSLCTRLHHRLADFLHIQGSAIPLRQRECRK